ncbi:hypothetical protein [Streptomyces sp. NPDC050560]|uniref:hypothetical protein n=1 Tax=Streptomyces sp. NPDC050560 TaxID=3365630 RepID=UPI0037AB6EDF
MGKSSTWLVGAVGDGHVAAWAPDALPALRAAASRPETAANWSRWREDARRGGEAVPVWGPDGLNTDEAFHLFAMLQDSPFCGRDAAGDLCPLEWLDELDDRVWPFHTFIVKDNPVAALFHGLGPDRASRLPGVAGDWLLSSDQVRAGLPDLTRTLTPVGEGARDLVLARIRDWPDVEDPVDLLDGPLRVHREAARAGLGVLAVRLWT